MGASGGREDEASDDHRRRVGRLAFHRAFRRAVRRLALEAGLEPWDVVEHTGLLRQLVLRKGVAPGEIMVFLVTSREASEVVDPLVAELVRLHPEITTVIQGIHDRPAAIATPVTNTVIRRLFMHVSIIRLSMISPCQ